MPGDATFDVGRIEATMTLDTDPFQAGLDAAVADALRARAEIDKALNTEANVDVGVNTDRALSELAVFEQLVNSSTVNLRVNLDTMSALADLAALESLSRLSAMAGGGGGTVLVPATGGGSGGATAVAAAAAAAAAGGNKGGGNGWLSALLWGGGAAGVFGLGAGLAGIGSLGSLAGLGPEHLLMTGVGLAGSLAGAGIGAGILGAGALGVAGVGMGTDMAGIGQAAGDITNVVKAQNALSTAVAVYGQNSTQAATAQARLNDTLGSFSPLARSAVLAAANTAQGFHQMFNAATGAAESTGADILNQLMVVGESFLPTIGKYAAENMKIIQSGLQPLLAWMQSPGGGLGIFTDLENIFQRGLPTAMHALDQGVQLFMKSIDVAAQHTGSFIGILDRFVTKWNSPPNFARWTTGMDNLIALFHRWGALVKIAVADIYQMFHADAGTASSIVVTLTAMLTKLHDWETSVAGQASMHNVFEAHKQEMLALLALIPPLISTFGHLYMTVGPPLTRLATLLLQVTLNVTNFLTHLGGGVGMFLSWTLGITLILAKLSLLGKTLTAVGAAYRLLTTGSLAASGAEAAAGGAASGGLLSKALGKVGGIFGGGASAASLGDEAALADGAAASTGGLAAALGAVSTVAPYAIAAVGALGAAYAGYEVISRLAGTSTKEFADDITKVKSGEILDSAASYDKAAAAFANLNVQTGGWFPKFEAEARAASAASMQITNSLYSLSLATGQTSTRLQMIAQSAGVDLTKPLSQTSTEMRALALFTGDTSSQFATLGQAWKDLHGPGATLQTQLQGLNELFSTQTPIASYVQTTNSARDAMSNLTAVVKTGTSSQEDIQNAFIGAMNALDQQVAAAKQAHDPLSVQNQLYLTGYNNLLAMAGQTTAAKNALHLLVQNLITPAQFDAMNSGLNTSGAAFQGLTDKINGTVGALKNVGTLAGALAAAPAVGKILNSGGLGIPGLANLINPSLLPPGRLNNPGQQARLAPLTIQTHLTVQGGYGDQALIAKVTSLMDKRDEQLGRALGMS